jgi:hypothetical protein
MQTYGRCQQVGLPSIGSSFGYDSFLPQRRLGDVLLLISVCYHRMLCACFQCSFTLKGQTTPGVCVSDFSACKSSGPGLTPFTQTGNCLGEKVNNICCMQVRTPASGTQQVRIGSSKCGVTDFTRGMQSTGICVYQGQCSDLPVSGLVNVGDGCQGSPCCADAVTGSVSFVKPSAVALKFKAVTNKREPSYSGDIWELFLKDNGAGVRDGNFAVGTLFVRRASDKNVIDSFSSVTGPGGKGLLPNESGSGYTVSLKEAPSDAVAFKDQNNFGFKFYIEANNKVGMKRGDFLIHVAPASWTLGCIGLNAEPERNVVFWNLLQAYLNKAGTIQLTVDIAGNPNRRV